MKSPSACLILLLTALTLLLAVVVVFWCKHYLARSGR